MIQQSRPLESTDGIMLDTNIFGELRKNPSSIVNIKALGKPLYITHIQADELNDTRNQAIKQELLRQLNVVDPEEDLPTFGFVLDVSRLNKARLTDGVKLGQFIIALNSVTKPKDLRSKPANNSKDALIAITAYENNLTILTNDKNLLDTAQKFGFDALWWRNTI